MGPNLSRQPFPNTQTVKKQQGRQQLIIYTDLVIDSVVGNQEKGFLRTMDAGNTDHQFDTTQRMFFPLRKTIFDSIAIDIQTANGQPAPLQTRQYHRHPSSLQKKSTDMTWLFFIEKANH